MRIEFEVGQRAVRLHRCVGHFVGDVAGFVYIIRFGKTFFRIAEYVVVILLNVVWPVLVNEIAFRFYRLLGIEVGRQRFVFHVDQLDRVFRNFFANSGNACHVIAYVPDLLHRERGFVMTHRKNAIGIGRVLSGDHGDNSIQGFRS